MYKILFIASAAIIMCCLPVLLYGAASNHAALLLAAMGCICPAILIMSLYPRKIRVFDPAFAVWVFTVIGCTGSAIFVAFGQGDRRLALMNGEPVEFFVSGAFWIAVALLVFGIGNHFSSRFNIVRFRIFNERQFYSYQRLLIVGAITLIITLVCAAIYIQKTGGIDLGHLSTKRYIKLKDESGDTVFGHFGYLLTISGISLPVLLILLGTTLRRERRINLYAAIVLGGLATVSILVPFVSSSRTNVVVVLIQMMMMTALFTRLKVRTLLITGALGFVVFSMMTAMRISSQSDGKSGKGFANSVVALAASGNGLSLTGTTLIIKHVPERLDYLYGTSLTSWVFQPIPRSIWPEKPDVALSKTIKSEILRLPTYSTGRPPSIMAEGWMNFGPIGFLLFSFAFGYVCRIFWETFRPLLARSVVGSAFFLVLLPDITGAVNSGFSQVLVRTLADILLMTVVVYMLGGGKRYQLQVDSHALRKRGPSGSQVHSTLDT